jgi:hypothetical protein
MGGERERTKKGRGGDKDQRRDEKRRKAERRRCQRNENLKRKMLKRKEMKRGRKNEMNTQINKESVLIQLPIN